MSYNIEGVSSNFQYPSAFIAKYNPDFICLQETWLFSFQKDNIRSFFPGYSHHSKSVDDNDPVPMNTLTRGHGGVATVWREESLQPKTTQDGSNRIVTTILDNVVIINAYMPCRGGSYSNANFKSEIDQIEEVCKK